MDFRTFDKAYDWNWILFVSFMSFSFLMIAAIMVFAYHEGKQQMQKTSDFVHACVDAGGSPVTTQVYIKGSKDHHLCINPSAIIEIK